MDFQTIYDNQEGLSKTYNRCLQDSEKYDIVVFIHDDIEVNDCLFFDKLADAKKRGLDVVGVAGGKGWEIPYGRDWRKTPIGWHMASERAGLRGFIVHAVDEGHRMFSTSYGSSPSRVLVIDGCFIALMNRGLGLLFDENFDFDFYDISLCMRAYAKKMEVGVEPILLTHHSVGMGQGSPRFMEAQRKFIEKYIEFEG